MSYLVIDIETESKEYRRRFADPFEKKNQIVMIQAKTKNEEPVVLYKQGRLISRDQHINLKNVELLVGQNIRFDLLYLWENQDLQRWLANGGQIWDTKVVEYLINGQNKTVGYHLDDLAVKYGGKLKPDHTKDLYKKGYTTLQIIDEIGVDKYKEYAIGDVINTEQVFIRQMNYVVNNLMLKLIKTYMRHYLAMLEIEANGLYIDKELLITKGRHQQLLVDRMREVIEDVAWKSGWNEFPFDINSPEHVSALLFGGQFIRTTKVPLKDDKTGDILRYKSGLKIGQVRYQNSEFVTKIKGIGLDKNKTHPLKKAGVYATGDEVLKNIDHQVVKLIQNYREQNKLLTTYYLPFVDLINPYTNCIHSEFNLAGTRTGRLSSKSPNVQNLHPTMLDCFKSRFEGGSIVELDWKQLEVVLAALLSQDEILLNQLKENVDMHQLNAIELFNKTDINPAERKLAKFLTFGILYGSGPKNMAIMHNISEDLAKRFIDQFYLNYPLIKLWHDKLAEEVNFNKYTQGDKTYSYIRGWAGKKYHVEAYPAKFEWQLKKGITESFLPTEYKNYPVQGFGADIMSFFVGRFYKYLQNKQNCIKMINEVHDSLILDCSPTGIAIIQQNQNVVEFIVEEVNKQFNSYYKGTPLLKLESKYGKTWADCKK